MAQLIYAALVSNIDGTTGESIIPTSDAAIISKMFCACWVSDWSTFVSSISSMTAAEWECIRTAGNSSSACFDDDLTGPTEGTNDDFLTEFVNLQIAEARRRLEQETGSPA